ncbi:MAG: TolC family protein [Thermoanaerobaculales bacterium]|jgi:outer membrane protein TolC|nr:TolC family protein [Thermoanaerobaculales bacterium]
MRNRIVMGMVAVLAMAGSAAGETSGAADPVARLRATQAAALAGSPGLRARRAELRAAAAASRLDAVSGSPYVEWQSEGLDSSGRQPNGADYIRVGTPFNLPGQIGPAKELVRNAEGWELAAQRVATLSAVADASRRWLALAAAVELEALSSARVERLDAALELQRKRFELGEIAGSEVRQLDLERITELARLTEQESRRNAAEAALFELCGDQWLAARRGDLAALVAVSTTPVVADFDDEQLAGVPLVDQLERDAELARASAALVAATAWGRAEIEAEWERIPALEGLPSYDAWGFRVSVPLPIGAAGHRQREQARARTDQAEAELEAARRRLQRAADNAATEAAGAEAKLAALEPALDGLAFVDRSLSEQFRLGAISYLAYIDGLSRFDRVVEEAINAHLALLQARLDLAVLLGDSTVFPLTYANPEEEN